MAVKKDSLKHKKVNEVEIIIEYSGSERVLGRIPIKDIAEALSEDPELQGAAVEASNNEGETALALAEEVGNTKIVEYLKKHVRQNKKVDRKMKVEVPKIVTSDKGSFSKQGMV